MLGRIRKTSGESASLTTFVALSKRLNSDLAALEDAITQRTELRADIERLLDATHQVHAEIIDRLSGISNRNQALEIGTRAHLLVSLISEGSIVKNPEAFKPIQDQLKEGRSSHSRTRPRRFPTTN